MSQDQQIPQKKDIKLGALDFKPSLNVSASFFVPSVAPVIEFSPVKEEKPEQQNERKNLVLPQKLSFDPNKFDVNAPVFKPANFKPLEGPSIIEKLQAQQVLDKQEKKAKNKKKDKRSASQKAKHVNNSTSTKKYQVKGTA
jgi:hypothetical protein